MSKITFRANDDLVERLETLDASKSEVMREALRKYLDGAEESSEAASSAIGSPDAPAETVDGILAERIDELVAERIDARLDEQPSSKTHTSAPDVNVNVNLDGVSADESDADVTRELRDGERSEIDSRKTESAGASAAANTDPKTCDSCGKEVDTTDVYCPNCGEKASHRVFCECHDEIRSDWSFCPSCGRRTPAADVLDGR